MSSRRSGRWEGQRRIRWLRTCPGLTLTWQRRYAPLKHFVFTPQGVVTIKPCCLLPTYLLPYLHTNVPAYPPTCLNIYLPAYRNRILIWTPEYLRIFSFGFLVWVLWVLWTLFYAKPWTRNPKPIILFLGRIHTPLSFSEDVGVSMDKPDNSADNSRSCLAWGLGFVWVEGLGFRLGLKGLGLHPSFDLCRFRSVFLLWPHLFSGKPLAQRGCCHTRYQPNESNTSSWRITSNH